MLCIKLWKIIGHRLRARLTTVKEGIAADADAGNTPRVFPSDTFKYFNLHFMTILFLSFCIFDKFFRGDTFNSYLKSSFSFYVIFCVDGIIFKG